MFQQYLRFFLAWVLISLQPVYAVIPGNQIIGWSKPFVATGRMHLSPVEGMDRREIKNLRFHGRYSDQDLGYAPVEHLQLRNDDIPMDAVAALIQRLFPSPAHDVLAINTLNIDPVRRWVTPAGLGRLFHVTEDYDRFREMDPDHRLYRIMESIIPSFYDAVRKQMRQKRKKPDVVSCLKRFRDTREYKFAQLLEEAFLTTRDPEHFNYSFYPERIVERALLAFMCMSLKDQKELDPYYVELHETLVVEEGDFPLIEAEEKRQKKKKKKVKKEDYERRDKNKEKKEKKKKKIRKYLTTEFTEDSYRGLLADVTEKRISINELARSPELMLILSRGFAFYDDHLPPTVGYRSVRYTAPDGTRYPFSNCGEVAMMSFLNACFFRKDIHGFQLPEGVDFTPELRGFYGEVLTSPTGVNASKVHDEWTQRVSNLNGDGQVSDPICYRKRQGRKVGGDENGTYEINEGLENWLRVVGVLFGHPEGWQLMNGDMEANRMAVRANLDLLCQLMSREGFRLSWEVKREETEHELDGFENPLDLSLTKEIKLDFSINGEESFQLTFGSGHFHFQRIDNASTGFSWLDHRELSKSIWHPTHSLFWSGTDSPTPTSEFPKRELFACDFDSIEGRLRIFENICKRKKDTGLDDLDYLFYRWLSPDGEYFANWTDRRTNRLVIESLANIMTIEEFLGLNVPPLIEMCTDEDDIGLQNKFSYSTNTSYSDLIGKTGLMRYILSIPGNIERLAGRLHKRSYGSDSDSDSDSDSSSTLSGDEEIKEFPLLQHIVQSGLVEFVEKALACGEDISQMMRVNDWKSSPVEGGRSRLIVADHTPVEIATQHSLWAMVLKLRSLGAECDEAQLREELNSCSLPREEGPDMDAFMTLIDELGIAVSINRLMYRVRYGLSLFRKVVQGAAPDAGLFDSIVSNLPGDPAYLPVLEGHGVLEHISPSNLSCYIARFEPSAFKEFVSSRASHEPQLLAHLFIEFMRAWDFQKADILLSHGFSLETLPQYYPLLENYSTIGNLAVKSFQTVVAAYPADDQGIPTLISFLGRPGTIHGEEKLQILRDLGVPGVPDASEGE